MTLLDFCLKKYPKKSLVVAHFDHGTRPSAKDDYLFVEKNCNELGVKFVGKHAKLGAGVSEEKARKARYEFFYSLLEAGDKLVVAHHLDDLVESVAINLIRGTGWRGLAVMDTKEIERPFLNWTKNDILKYASSNGIVFREDPTNSQDNYLRNRIRFSVRNMDRKTKKEIFDLRGNQIEKKMEISGAIKTIIDGIAILSENEREIFLREPFFGMEDDCAIEILKMLLEKNEIFCTRPQLQNFLGAVRNYKAGKYFNLPNDRLVRIDKKTFMV